MGMTVEQQFALTRPCVDCPFKAGRNFPLQPGRRQQIIEDLADQRHSTFHCHKSVYRKSGLGEDPNSRQHCAGAIAVLRNMGRDTQAAQLATRLRIIPWDHYEEAKQEVIDEDEID